MAFNTVSVDTRGWPDSVVLTCNDCRTRLSYEGDHTALVEFLDWHTSGRCAALRLVAQRSAEVVDVSDVLVDLSDSATRTGAPSPRRPAES